MKRQQAHPSEEVVGRITKRGTLDRRYRIRYELPEPVEETWADVAKALACWLLVIVAYFVTIAWAVGVAG